MHSSARRASSIALTSQMPPAISTTAPTSKMILAVLRSASVSSSSRFGSAMRLLRHGFLHGGDQLLEREGLGQEGVLALRYVLGEGLLRLARPEDDLELRLSPPA